MHTLFLRKNVCLRSDAAAEGYPLMGVWVHVVQSRDMYDGWDTLNTYLVLGQFEHVSTFCGGKSGEEVTSSRNVGCSYYPAHPPAWYKIKQIFKGKLWEGKFLVWIWSVPHWFTWLNIWSSLAPLFRKVMGALGGRVALMEEGLLKSYFLLILPFLSLVTSCALCFLSTDTLFLPCGSQRWNSGHKVLWQVSPLPEPSYQSSYI